MCFGDWRVGRLIRQTIFSTLVGNGATFTIGADPTRVGLLVSCIDSAAGVTSWTTLFDVADSKNALFVQSGSGPQLLTIATHGSLPSRSIQFIAVNTATVIVSVLAFHVPEDMLAVGLEQFNTEYSRRF